MIPVLVAAAKSIRNAAVKPLNPKEPSVISPLVESLIKTKALQVAPAGQVFWYTSGTVGPYYINTHYLYGSAAQATALLDFIEAKKEDRQAFPALLAERIHAQRSANPIYNDVINRLVQYVHGVLKEGFDCVSGGERRDWFFSVAVAMALEKPHLYIYKDLDIRIFNDGRVETVSNLAEKKILHIADLVTEASSYVKNWLPALKRLGGRMSFGLNVVDRAQGGLGVLAEKGVAGTALLSVDETLFGELRQAKLVDEAQVELLRAYYRDPHGAMCDFLRAHPEFVQRALRQGDHRTVQRARLLITENPYQMDWAALGVKI